MEVKAHGKWVRLSPRKARLCIDMIRGRSVDDAKKILMFTTKSAAHHIMKVLDSAIANAKNNFKLDPDRMYIKKAFVNEANTLKRWRPRAFGRATRIRKRNSHITIVLEEL
jgi:large subunit ribosomal protein L22